MSDRLLKENFLHCKRMSNNINWHSYKNKPFYSISYKTSCLTCITHSCGHVRLYILFGRSDDTVLPHLIRHSTIQLSFTFKICISKNYPLTFVSYLFPTFYSLLFQELYNPPPSCAPPISTYVVSRVWFMPGHNIHVFPFI